MRKAVRAIIVNNDQILVMHRDKFSQEYDILIGGAIEMGETPEQAIIREIKEECGVVVGPLKLTFVEDAKEPYGIQFIYLCNYLSGEPVLSSESVEFKINQMGKNRYQPVWRNISELANLVFRSDKIKNAMIKAFNEGFPSEPVDITNL